MRERLRSPRPIRTSAPTSAPTSPRSPSLRTTFAAVAALGALALTTGIADDANAQSSYRLAPVGGRTTLVGGTGVVFGSDSASAFLNPATAQRVDKNRLSFSVDFYSLSLFQSGRWYQPGAIDRERFGDVGVEGNTAVRSFDFDSLPGSLCLFFGISDLPFLAREAKIELRERRARLGICLASIQYNAFTFNAEDYEQQTPSGVSRQSHNFRQTFRRLSFGPTYSMYVDNHLTIGASVHASRSSHRSIIGATATTYGPGGAINSSFYNVARGDSHELTATLGATYRISKRQTVGIALQSPSLHVFGSGGINYRTSFDTPTAAASQTFTADGSFATSTPPRVAIGTGVESEWGSAELDVAFHPPISSAYNAEFDGRQFERVSGGPSIDRTRSVNLKTPALGAVNVGVGGEIFTSPRLSLLGGLGTDISIVPKGSLPSDPLHYYPARMHRLTASFGVGSHGSGGDLLIGIEGSYGWGERLTPNVYQLPPRLDTADQTQFGLLFVLAGSTSFQTFKRTVEAVKKELDPKEDKSKVTPKPSEPPVPQKNPTDEPKVPGKPPPLPGDSRQPGKPEKR